MRDNIHKFIFLGIVGFSVVFSRVYLHASLADHEANSKESYSQPADVKVSFHSPNFISSESRVHDGNSKEKIPNVPEETIFNSKTAHEVQARPLYGDPRISFPPREVSDGTSSDAPWQRIQEGMPENVQSEIALVSSLEGEDEYFSYHAERRWPLASLTKLMTAVIAKERLDLSLLFPEFSDGTQYRGDDLLTLLLLASSNHAADSLASSIGEENFVAAMNEKAVSWKLMDTHFSDPSGLTSSNQSTAHDMRRLLEKIITHHPEILDMTRKSRDTVREVLSGKTQVVQNINLLVRHQDFLGGKTGYTDDALGNLASVFFYDGHRLFILVMGTNDRFRETEKLLAWFKNSFRNPTASTP